MTRSYTDRLRRAEAGGAIVVCSVAPYENWRVTYAPRHGRDPEPWTVAGYRFSGRECHALTAHDLEVWAELDKARREVSIR